MNSFSVGTWLSLPNESIAEIFAKAGYEWIVIDLEHSSIDIHQAEQLIRVIDLAGAKPFIRLSGHDATQIKRVLDAGAKGILAPMIETQEQIQDIISACNYPPNGIRGMGLARAQGYGEAKTKQEYISQASNQVEIYAQIESLKGLTNCKAIFSHNIAGYFIGPYDLSASLGNPGIFNSKQFQSAEIEIMSAAKTENIRCGYHLVEPDTAQIAVLQQKGYDMLAFSVDIRMLDISARLPFDK
jgi:2-keto-3-deoxy-L-rhamnonate aldolase RhmA|tara:strand:+ start:130 stop:855 length:726 start_codon:yes stop_codon:yes gene_type:complete